MVRYLVLNKFNLLEKNSCQLKKTFTLRANKYVFIERIPFLNG